MKKTIDWQAWLASGPVMQPAPRTADASTRMEASAALARLAALMGPLGDGEQPKATATK